MEKSKIKNSIQYKKYRLERNFIQKSLTQIK